MGLNRVIGRDNDLPWRLPEDLKRFKQVTMGKPVVMGRKTYESIGQPLAGRHNIVVTGNRHFRASGCTVVHSIKEALDAAGDAEEVMIIGGARLYEQFLPLAERLYLTLIKESFDGDVYFPEISEEEWEPVSWQEYAAGAERPFAYAVVVMERRRPRNASTKGDNH